MLACICWLGVMPSSQSPNNMMEYDTVMTQVHSLTSNLLSMPLWLHAMVLLFAFLMCFKLVLTWVWNMGYACGHQDALKELAPEVCRNKALSIFLAEHSKVAQEHSDFSKIRPSLEHAAVQRSNAISIMRRALHESFDHVEKCPLHGAIWLTRDNTWHASPMCPQLPDGPLHLMGARQIRPCNACSRGEVTPYIPDQMGQSLLEELEDWIISQGSPAW